MISKKRYLELKEYLHNGANLPPINLDQIAEFEEKFNLRKYEGNTAITPQLKDLKHMLIQN